MKYAIGLLVALAVGASTAVSSVRMAMFAISEKVPVLLAVLLAAVLVRLARGMPTFPFEKIKHAQAKTATNAFRHLLRSYNQSFIVIITAIILNLLAPSFEKFGDDNFFTLYAFVLGFSNTLSLIVVYFLVSADLRISYIQADLTDQVTDEKSSSSADETVETVRGAFANKQKVDPSITKV